MSKREGIVRLIKFVRDFAQLHYNEGGYINDIWEDRDIIDFLRDVRGKSLRSVKRALLKTFKFHKNFMEEMF